MAGAGLRLMAGADPGMQLIASGVRPRRQTSCTNRQLAEAGSDPVFREDKHRIKLLRAA